MWGRSGYPHDPYRRVQQPVPVHLNGLTEGYAWWLNFRSLDRFGRGVYDLYVTQGAGFFFVDTVIIGRRATP
jgi:hypothetical protein